MDAQRWTAGDQIAFLQQGIDLVARLDTKLFTGTSELCPGGSVGAHFRHCLDFYLSFLDGLGSGRIDYDARKRDPALESAPERARDAFGEVARRLETLGDVDRDRELLVRGDGSRDGEGGWSRSSVGRELQFLLSHTIHHFALIGFMLRASGFEIDASFGVAPSTLQHWSAARIS